jgi:hypothetical protein
VKFGKLFFAQLAVGSIVRARGALVACLLIASRTLVAVIAGDEIQAAFDAALDLLKIF